MSDHELNPEEGTLLRARGDGAGAIIETAQQAVDPVKLEEDGMYAFLTDDGGVVPFDLEQFRANPDRPRGIYKPATVDSFIAYVDRWDAEQATVWVHPTQGRIRAVLDDHEPDGHDGAGWGEHRAALDLLVTPEWEFWTQGDRSWMEQMLFAEHIEEGIEQIRYPAAAYMLELAQSFHASTDATFRSRQVLASGEVRVAYDETIEAQAGQHGEITIPKEFELAISPFVGEHPYKVMARFRYRLAKGELKLGYALIEPDAVVRDCLEKIAEKLVGQFGERVFIGEPAEVGAAKAR